MSIMVIIELQNGKLSLQLFLAYSFTWRLENVPLSLSPRCVGKQGSWGGWIRLSRIHHRVRHHCAPELTEGQIPDVRTSLRACVLGRFGWVSLCNPKDCSPPGTSVQGILQARTLECVAMFSSREFSWPRGQIYFYYIAGGFFTFWATWEAPRISLGGSQRNNQSSRELANKVVLLN